MHTHGTGHRRHARRWAASAAVIALTFAACGGDDDDGAANTPVATAAPGVTEAPAETDPPDTDPPATDAPDAPAATDASDTNDASDAPATTEASEPAPEPAELRLAYVQGFGSLPVHVAQVNGFFADRGLTIEETPGNEMPLWVQALDSQYDVVLSIPSIQMGSMVAGIDSVVVSGLVRSTVEAPNIPLMTADPEIQTWGDLAGKRVGVLNLAGTIAESILFLVEHEGGDPNDVTLVPTPFPAMQDSLEAGLIDAATLAIPFDAALAASGDYLNMGEPVVAAAEVMTGQTDPVNAYFIASRDYAESNADVIERFRAALDEAIEWILDNDAESRDLLVSWLGLPPAVAAAANIPVYSTEVSAEDFDFFYQLAVDRGSLIGEPDLANVVFEP